MELLLYDKRQVKIHPRHQHEGIHHLLMKVKISHKIQNPHHRMNTSCPIIICLILAIKVILLKPEK